MTATTSVDPAIADFAARVRRSLDDLPVDEIEDLTEGLEADLTEKALEEDLGDPEEYAIELRSAAGLPARLVKTSRPLSRASIGLGLRALTTRIRAHTLGSQLLDFAIALRPGWWILRAWAILQLMLLAVGGRGTVSFLPDTPLRSAIFIVLTIVSVQWGRGLWTPRWLRLPKVLVNALALLALPFLLVGAAGSAAQAYAESVSDHRNPIQPGLVRDGELIMNIFAYDSAGEPLTGVQLFDQNGTPLSAKLSGESYIYLNDRTALVPSTTVTSGNGWNVFPLQGIPLSAIDNVTGRPLPNTAPSQVTPPFPRVQPLLVPATLPDGIESTPAPRTTPAPTVSPSTGPMPPTATSP